MGLSELLIDEGAKPPSLKPLCKTSHTYLAMMKLDTVITYRKKIQKYI